MKGKIDYQGFLTVSRERSGNPMNVEQCCPWIDSDSDTHCGDWCPMFDVLKDNFRANMTIRLSCSAVPVDIELVD